ncbi:MAG: hypothetical protein F4229_00570, partial [Gammaproteobacteria bacterium]|nr:hypothetical protein [Gammaproteobacteria bacterium]MYH15943.1 hypothetical protein [Gammaproteobacteria bacterium]MYK82105.1 hypothetical protein [Gammaproteobacteria bacterium]
MNTLKPLSLRASPKEPQGPMAAKRQNGKVPGIVRRWRLLALALLAGLAAGPAAHAALSAAPNPSSNGSYTVSWTAVSG